MIILKSTYVSDPATLQQHLAAHLDWVEEGYGSGQFLASGLRTGSVGAVILVQGMDASAAELMLSRDPFVKNGVAEYEIVEFDASRTAGGLTTD